jgi:uncharacterized protein
VDGQPFVIATLCGRDGQRLYLHGSAASRKLRELARHPDLRTSASRIWISLIAVCFRSFHELPLGHCIWKGAEDRESKQKINSLRVISEHLIAGRWQDVRGPRRN